jgi:hypothetical protein
MFQIRKSWFSLVASEQLGGISRLSVEVSVPLLGRVGVSFLTYEALPMSTASQMRNERSTWTVVAFVGRRTRSMSVSAPFAAFQ